MTSIHDPCHLPVNYAVYLRVLRYPVSTRKDLILPFWLPSLKVIRNRFGSRRVFCACRLEFKGFGLSVVIWLFFQIRQEKAPPPGEMPKDTQVTLVGATMPDELIVDTLQDMLPVRCKYPNCWVFSWYLSIVYQFYSLFCCISGIKTLTSCCKDFRQFLPALLPQLPFTPARCFPALCAGRWRHVFPAL